MAGSVGFDKIAGEARPERLFLPGHDEERRRVGDELSGLRINHSTLKGSLAAICFDQFAVDDDSRFREARAAIIDGERGSKTKAAGGGFAVAKRSLALKRFEEPVELVVAS